ncbi:hypothetical protein N9V94_00485 [bacterium]|nr:hypothetical protein [bacterium]
MKTTRDFNRLAKRARTGVSLLLGCFALVVSGTLAQAQLSDGLIGYWPFDGDLEDKSESVPPAHGAGKIWSGDDVEDDPEALADFATAELTFADGKFGSGIDLDDREYVETPLEVEDRFDFGAPEQGASNTEGGSPTGFSVSAWFRVDEFSKGWQSVIGKGEQDQWRIHRNAETDTLSVAGGGGDDDGLGSDVTTTEFGVNDGEFHHVVLVSDTENDVTIHYLDGEEVGRLNGVALNGNPMPMMIGQNPDTGDRTWQGMIDDVAIWDHAITEEEVEVLWNGGDGISVAAFDGSDPNIAAFESVSIGPLPVVDTDTAFEVTLRNTGGTQALEVSGFDLGGADADHFTVVSSPTSIPSAGRDVVQLTFNNLEQLGVFKATLTYTTNDPDADDQTIVVDLTAIVPNPDGPEAHYRFDETDVAQAAADSTVNGRVGMYDENGGSINLAAPGLDAATGTAFAVAPGGAMKAPAFPLADFTITGWFRSDSLGSLPADLRLVFGQGEGTPEVALLEAGGALHYYGDETILFSSEVGTIETGQAYHIAVTFDSASGEVALILNGVEVATGSAPLPSSDGEFYVGAYGANGNLGFDGVIDDVQFYSRILSADNIIFLNENPGEALNPIAAGEDPDSDEDGLSDKDEIAIYMTDPLKVDTDGDGLSDGDEVASGLNPLLTDTDGDGFDDGGDEDPLDPDVPGENQFLLVHYDFNEGSGTEIGNRGSAGVGELINAHDNAWVSVGAPDGSGYLNFTTDGAGASAQHIATGLEGADNPFFGDVDYTAMAWVRFDTIATGGINNDKMIFGQVVDGEVLHHGGRQSRLKFGHWGNDTNGGSVVIDEWVHLAFRYQEGRQSIIVDGETVASSVQGALNEDGEIAIGSTHITDDRDMSGDLDEIRIYSAALSNEAIAKIAAGAGDPEADTDGDGLKDGFELESFGNLDQNGDGDPDGDGLTNLEEAAEGTHPGEADTDGDSVNDGIELTDMTDPLVADADADGLNDGEEKANGTLPDNRDSDSDGYTDGSEVALGFDPLDATVPTVPQVLVVHYDFNEGSGTAIGNNGSASAGELVNAHAGAWVAEGSPDGSGYLNFTGDGAGTDAQHVATGLAGADNPFVGSQDYTAMAWVRYDTVATGGNDDDKMIFGQAVDENVLHLGARGNTYLQGHWGNDNTGGTISVNEWRHVAFRYQDGEQTILVDGEAIATDAKGGVTVDAEVVIGTTRSSEDREMSGDLDEVRIYAGALLDASIADIVAGGDGNLDGGGDDGDRPSGISDVVKADGAGGAISFNFPAGTTYDVEFSTDLIEWSVIATGITGSYTEADADLNGAPSGYYRGVAK